MHQINRAMILTGLSHTMFHENGQFLQESEFHHYYEPKIKAVGSNYPVYWMGILDIGKH